ncbi:MAG TPA: tetratricopeptide repeat protein [Opitutaceae bacterium]|nr:tetratricopeptide repeat protein [Opitutaceae bacterium]
MPAPSLSTTSPSRWVTVACAGGLVLATVAAYHGSFRVPFLFDDTFAIVDNRSIRHLADVKDVLFPAAGYGITVSGRPILNLSLALCYAISGTQVWSYHAFNLLIHSLGGLTLFGLVRRTLAFWNVRSGGRSEPAPRPGRGAPVRDSFAPTNETTLLAAAVALLWLLHPLQTEAVTYIIQRTESLMGLFFLLTFYCFTRAATSPRPWRWRILAVASCLAGAGTKEVTSVAPLLVFLYDRTFVAGSFREAWRRRRWLHLSLAATWVPLGLLVASTGWNRGGTAGFDVGVSPIAYWLTQFEAIARYLRQTFWPHPLIFEYGTFWAGWREAAPYALLVVPLILLTLVALVRWPAIGFLGAWVLAILAPTSLVPGTMQMIVEHRMYLPLAAIIAGVVVGLHRFLVRWSCSGLPAGPRRGASALLAVAPSLLLAVPLGFVTAQRNAVYRSDLALWQQTTEESPASAKAQSSFGTALYARKQIREAMLHYRIALRLDPHSASTNYNAGLAYAALGFPREAAKHYQAALRINPLFYPAHYELGMVLLQLGRPQDAIGEFAETARLNPAMPEARYEWGVALAKQDRLAEAVVQYEAALKIDPKFVDAECDLGTALYGLNRYAEAIACYRRALEARPDLTQAHLNLGMALARTGAIEPAVAEYAAAVRLDPNNAQGHLDLGLAYGQMGRLPQATAELQKAVELDPSSADAHFNLGVALVQTGRPLAAVDEYEAALRRRPNYPAAHLNLGIALLQLRRVSEARGHFEAALRIDPQFAPARALLQRLDAAGFGQ